MSWLLAPLVLFLPGYAIAALAFPPGTVSPAERGVYAVALSVAVAAVGGLVLQLAVGLDRASWALLLLLVTALCGLRAMTARRRAPRPARPRLRLPWALPFVATAFAAAGLIAGLAVVSARDGVLEGRAATRFTDFWMTPARAAGRGGAETFAVGVRSHEAGESRYVLRLSSGGLLLARREVVLAPGRQRVWDFSAPAGSGRVVAAVRRDGEPSRRLYLQGEG